jgi:hypothetical protein
MSLRRILVSLLPLPAMAAVAWVGGYDFDSRGFWPAYGLVVALCACCFLYGILSTKDEP